MEKMKVLQMLEDGKITADEAAKLLQAVDNPKKYTHTTPPPRDARSSYGSQTPPPPPPHGTDTAAELGRKIETFARDMEPKIARLTEAVVEKTVNMADKISKSLSEGVRPAAAPPPQPSPKPDRHESRPERYESRPERYAPKPAPPQASAASSRSYSSSAALTERSFEEKVYPEYNELSMAALNGDVLIKGYNGDKITARVSWRAKRHGANIELMKFGNKYYLNYDEDDFERVSIDAYVPEGMFNRVVIRSVNGRVDISTLKSDFLDVSNASGEIILRDIEAGDIAIDSDNTKISVSNITGSTGKIENFNGLVQAELLDISKLKVSTFNAPINISIANFIKFTDYDWTVETNNGKLNLNLPTHPLLGYNLKAQNTLGDIKIGLTGLNYSINLPTLVEARSIGYNDSTRTVTLNLETSNAPLIVN